MTYEYELKTVIQVKKWNGYGDVWNHYLDGATITLTAQDFKEATAKAEASLYELARDYRYDFRPVSITELVQEQEYTLS